MSQGMFVGGTQASREGASVICHHLGGQCTISRKTTKGFELDLGETCCIEGREKHLGKLGSRTHWFPPQPMGFQLGREARAD